jgi:hypothetical protein
MAMVDLNGNDSLTSGIPEATLKLAPPDYYDPVLEVFKKDIDRTLLRENLKLSPEERLLKFESFAAYARELREAGQRARAAGKGDAG